VTSTIGTQMSKPRTLDRQVLLSILIPVYNEAESLPHLFTRLTALAAALPVSIEFVLVNDGSRDASLPLMVGFSMNDARFRIVDLSRNFGHQLAVSAGLSVVRGDVVAILDADLQDPPEVLVPMLQRWAAGVDIVYGQRRSRKGETRFKRAAATAYYRLLSRLANVEIPKDSGDFRIADRRVVDVINSMPERHRFLRGMFAWVGFSQEAYIYDRDPRLAGKTKYSIKKMVLLSLDGILSFSVKPLRWMVVLGLLTTMLAFLSGVYLLAVRLMTPNAFSPGFAGMFIVMLFMFGVNFICLGVIGEYLGRSFVNVQGRPPYIIRSVFEAMGQQESGLHPGDKDARRNAAAVPS
jgi:glycosyltransferase involved in cell wall biosynthesis